MSQTNADAQTNVDLVRRIMEAVGRGDLQAVLAELDPDVEIDDTDIPDAGDSRGHDAFIAWNARWSESWESWKMEDFEFRAGYDNQVIALFKMIVTGKGSGIELDRNDALVVSVRDGKVVKLVYYNDQAKALKASGLI